jgi:hypothetical protein
MAGYSVGQRFDARNELQLFSDFESLPGWLEALNDGGSGTNTLNDAKNGTYSLVTAAADNDYHVLASKSEAFKIEAGKPIRAACRVKCAEANTDDVNLWFGFSDTLTTGGVQVDGLGPLATYDGALFFKVDGGTVWQAETSNAGTQFTSSSVSAFTSDTWTILEIDIQTSGASDTVAQVVFLVNGSKVATHALTITGLEEMHLILGVKAGGANAETLIVDWISVTQTR